LSQLTCRDCTKCSLGTGTLSFRRGVRGEECRTRRGVRGEECRTRRGIRGEECRTSYRR